MRQQTRLQEPRDSRRSSFCTVNCPQLSHPSSCAVRMFSVAVTDIVFHLVHGTFCRVDGNCFFRMRNYVLREEYNNVLGEEHNYVYEITLL